MLWNAMVLDVKEAGGETSVADGLDELGLGQAEVDDGEGGEVGVGEAAGLLKEGDGRHGRLISMGVESMCRVDG